MGLTERKFKVDYKNLVIVYIQWCDAEADNAWKDIKEICKIKECKSAGILVYEDEDQIVLSNTLASDSDVTGDIAIPKGMFKEIKRYKL